MPHDLKRLQRRLCDRRPKAVVPAQPEPEIIEAPAPEPVEPETVEPEAVEAPEVEWSMANTKSELLAAAEDAGIEVRSNWNKAQILSALTDAD